MEKRIVLKKGIVVKGQVYFSPELACLIGQRVNFKADYSDPNTLYVFALDGSFLCAAERLDQNCDLGKNRIIPVSVHR